MTAVGIPDDPLRDVCREIESKRENDVQDNWPECPNCGDLEIPTLFGYYSSHFGTTICSRCALEELDEMNG